MGEPTDALLGGEFAAYRDVLLAAVEPAGPTAVRETVRRRRRRAAITVATVVVLAIAVPVAGWAAAGREAGPAPGGTTSPSPAPTAPASPTPGAPSASVTPSGSPAAPDGRISRAQLLTVPLDLPAWLPGSGCFAGDVRLRAAVRDDGDVVLAAVDYGDVDGDGATETVALLRCVLGTGGPAQVVAFDRDAAGRIVAMGRVVRTQLEKPQWLAELSVRNDGAVRVRVADHAPGGGWPIEQSIMQWRTYRWTGDGFRQVAGPTSFPPNPAATPPSTPSAGPKTLSLGVSATRLVYGAPNSDGLRRGTSTVTVTNTGGATVQYPMVIMLMNGRDDAEHAIWPAECAVGNFRSDAAVCTLYPLRPGERRSVVLPFLTTADGPDGEATVEVAPGTGDLTEQVPGTKVASTTYPVLFSG